MCENSQDYAQKPQQNCAFMNSASGHTVCIEKGRHRKYQALTKFYFTYLARAEPGKL
jgi:hypothetical protein